MDSAGWADVVFSDRKLNEGHLLYQSWEMWPVGEGSRPAEGRGCGQRQKQAERDQMQGQATLGNLGEDCQDEASSGAAHQVAFSVGTQRS